METNPFAKDYKLRFTDYQAILKETEDVIYYATNHKVILDEKSEDNNDSNKM